MHLRVKGYATVSEDGMIADANGSMPASLVIEADQKFLSDSLDRADVLVHGRNSHENQPQSGQRNRLIATRKVQTIEHVIDRPNALLWARWPFSAALKFSVCFCLAMMFFISP